MTVKVSKFSQGILPVVTADCAGDLITNDYFIDLAAADVVLNDIVDLGPLPAYHTVVDAMLIADDLDSNGAPTLTLDVGLMSGNVGSEDGARTCGAELFSGANTAQAGGVARMSAKGGFLIKPTGADRSIGVKFAAAAATAQAGRLRVRVVMASGDQNIQF